MPRLWPLIAACAFFTITASFAANAPAADAPEPQPPAGASVVREVQAGGAQVYACRANATGVLAWTLVGPKAILLNDDGTDFGRHSAGPTWTALDGSSIVADGAHPLIKIDRPHSIPALILAITSSHGSGVLQGVRFVRRAQTDGGVAPASGCDAAHLNATAASRYTAVYTFYR